jgi:hypothetical protein
MLVAAQWAPAAGWLSKYAADTTNAEVTLYAKHFTDSWVIEMAVSNATDCSVLGRNDLFPPGFFTNSTYTYSDYYDAGLNTNWLRWATNRPAVTSVIVQGSSVVGTAIVSRVERGGAVQVAMRGEDLFQYDLARAIQERVSVIPGAAPFSDDFYYRYGHGLLGNRWGDIDNLAGAKRTVASICSSFLNTNSIMLETYNASNLLQSLKLPTNYFDFSYHKVHFNPFPPRYRQDTNKVTIIPLPDQIGPIYTNIIENPDGSEVTFLGTNGQQFLATYINSNILDGFTSADYQATNLIPIVNRLRYIRWSDESTGVINRRKYRYSRLSAEGFDKWWEVEGCGQPGNQVKNEVINAQTNEATWYWGGTNYYERITNRINQPRSPVLVFTFDHTETEIMERHRQSGVFYIATPPHGLDSFIIDSSSDNLSVSGSLETQYPTDFIVSQRGPPDCIPTNGIVWSAAMWHGYATNTTYNAYTNSYYDYGGAGVTPGGGDVGAWGVDFTTTTYPLDHECNGYNWLLDTNGYHKSRGPSVHIIIESNSVIAATNHTFPLVWQGRPASALSVIDDSLGIATYGFSYLGLCADESSVFTRSAKMTYSHQATIYAAQKMERTGEGFGFMDFACPGGFKYYDNTEENP